MQGLGYKPRVGRDVDGIELAQVSLDLPHRQAPGIQGDDLVVEAIQAGLALGHDLRFKGAITIARHLDLDRSVLGQDRLGRGPIAVVARPAAGRIALLVAEMVRQFGAQRSLEQRLLELLEQAVLTQQVFRLLVARQKLVKMFWLDWHRESPSSGYPRIALTQSS
jgi:hypothetical protein